jgi:Tol biopolymer transport system component
MEHPTFATGLDFSRPRLAPDGHRVAVAIGSGLQGQNLGDIWVLDLTREIRNRLTTNGHSTFPAWSPDGRLALSSDRGDGQYQLHVMGFSGAGSDVELPTNRGTNYAFSWSPDGRFVATVSVSPATANDIWVLPVDNPAQGVRSSRHRVVKVRRRSHPMGAGSRTHPITQAAARFT